MVFEVLEGYSAQYKKSARAFQLFIMTMILSNAVVMTIETIDKYGIPFKSAFERFDLISVTVFSIEYLLRVWSCTADKRYSRPIIGRLKFICTPMAMIDLLAILPFYVSPMTDDLRFMRILRVFRIFRVLKLVRYSKALHAFKDVTTSKKEELIITTVLGMTAIFFASAFMYFVEHTAQPEAFSSIPASMWWAVVTLANVGYGDVVPITVEGKILGGIIAILGIGMFALPAGILGSAFVERFEEERFRDCPHCGKPISNKKKKREKRAIDRSSGLKNR